MPRHKSAAKRVITNAKSRVRNISATTRMRSAIRQVRSATTRTAAEAAYREATAVLDRTASKGVIKEENANRQKARLARFERSLPA